jgi:hypothetical protein
VEKVQSSKQCSSETEDTPEESTRGESPSVYRRSNGFPHNGAEYYMKGDDWGGMSAFDWGLKSQIPL